MEWILEPRSTPGEGGGGGDCAKYKTCGVQTSDCPSYKCFINIEL